MQNIYFSPIKRLPLEGVLAAVGCDSVSSCLHQHSSLEWWCSSELSPLPCIALIYSMVSVRVSETRPEGEEIGSSPPRVLQC